MEFRAPEVKTIEGYRSGRRAWSRSLARRQEAEGKLQPPTKTTFPNEANQPDPVLACPRQATFEVKAAAWDSGRSTAVFVAGFMGYSEYVYSTRGSSTQGYSSAGSTG